MNTSIEIEIAKKIYNAININDVSTYLSFFDENVERFETFGGSLKGLAELKTNFSQGRDTWAEGSCEPERFIAQDNKLVVYAHVLVRQKNKQEWIDGHVTDVFVFENEKVVAFHSFADHQEALAWAGIVG